MTKNKVLTLYQKAKICKMSLTPGFNKEKCEKEFGIQRSCSNKILQSKSKFLDLADSSTFAYLMVHERKKPFKCVICDASFQKHLKSICQHNGS